MDETMEYIKLMDSEQLQMFNTLWYTQTVTDWKSQSVYFMAQSSTWTMHNMSIPMIFGSIFYSMARRSHSLTDYKPMLKQNNINVK